MRKYTIPILIAIITGTPLHMLYMWAIGLTIIPDYYQGYVGGALFLTWVHMCMEVKDILSR